MAELITRNRKSDILTPSQLLCLSKIPTVNITSGCIHGCIYCYATGYSQYPGDDKVILFANTAEKLREELTRKRKKPQAVYFCPSCDPFQPLPEILDQTYRVMKTLLLRNIGIQFVTKASIPANFIDLFAQSSSLVCAQVGITTIDDNIRRIFEPNAASISDRLSTMRKLVSIGVKTSVRADPLIYDVTDSDKSMTKLFSAVAKSGVKEIAAGYLFLRPAIRKNLEENIKNTTLLRSILLPYFHFQAKLLPVGINSQGLMLPREIREKAFARIKSIASDFELSVHVCGCKNSDITTESCNITRLSPSAQLYFFS